MYLNETIVNNHITYRKILYHIIYKNNTIIDINIGIKLYKIVKENEIHIITKTKFDQIPSQNSLYANNER